jgi:hypothetical protein
MAERPPPRIYSLGEIAANWSLGGKDPQRVVRKLIRKHGIPFHKTGRAIGLDDRQLAQLLEVTTKCPPQPAAKRKDRSASAAAAGTPTSPSGSVGKAAALGRLRALAKKTGPRRRPGSVVAFPK